MASSSKPSLLVITTGGTIDKDYPRTTGGHAFEFGETSAAQRILSSLPQMAYDVRIESVCAKDSLEMCEEQRIAITAAIRNSSAQHIVITHGTDTMIETARYVLSSCKPGVHTVVFTGAAKPERFKDSDASFNLGAAIAAVGLLPRGSVAICMGGLVIGAMECTRTADGTFILEHEKA